MAPTIRSADVIRDMARDDYDALQRPSPPAFEDAVEVNTEYHPEDDHSLTIRQAIVDLGETQAEQIYSEEWYRLASGAEK